MGRIVVQNSVSLDGYFEGPNRDISWHQVDAEVLAYLNETLAPASVFVSGRTTWDLMSAYWPTADEAPDVEPEHAQFAAIWRAKPKVVYSTTLAEAGWNTTIVRSVVPQEVRALRDSVPGDLVLSGNDLAGSLFEHDLVDEVRTFVNPVLLGAGNPLFRADRPPVPLTLTENRPFPIGVVLLRYDVRHPAGT